MLVDDGRFTVELLLGRVLVLLVEVERVVLPLLEPPLRVALTEVAGCAAPLLVLRVVVTVVVPPLRVLDVLRVDV